MMTYFINDLEAIRMAFGPGVLMLVDGLVLGSFAFTVWQAYNLC
jgi:ATP-binding cassette, subfamily B, multidrug efflux pump